MATTTKEIIKSDWLNIDQLETKSDDMIDRLIASVDKTFEAWCNQPLTATAIEIEFEGCIGSEYNTLYTVPVTLTSLSYRDIPTDAYTAITTAAIFKRNGTQRIYNEDGFLYNYYKAVATVGYTTAPADVVVCVCEMVKELYLNTPFAAQGDRFGVSAITESADGVSFSKAILQMKDRVMPKLQAYKRITI